MCRHLKKREVKMSINPDELLINLHVQFMRRYLKNASQSFTHYEPTRPTMLFFMISGLDIMNALDTINEEERSQICNWIYTQQIEPRSGLKDDGNELKKCGFYGSRTLTIEGDTEIIHELNVGHLAMTYSALCCLIILGDDLSRVNRTAVLKAVKHLQNKDGSFLSSVVCGENDMRFIYCAIAICYMLDEFSYIDIGKAVDFIVRSMHYDGGIALRSGLESHGGSSFCGIAALSLLGRLNTSFDERQMRQLQRWLVLRQESGFQGRPYKEVDTCYSFWIGAALQILGIFSFVAWESNRKSLLGCQKNTTGGFSKHYYSTPDLMHTYFALCGLSLMKEPSLREMHPSLNMSMRAYQHLKQVHNSWSVNA